MAPVSIELLNGLLATTAAKDNILTVVVTLLCFGGNPTVYHTASILEWCVFMCELTHVEDCVKEWLEKSTVLHEALV